MRLVTSKGKPEKVDLLKLYTEVDTARWNTFLANCLRRQDLQALERMLYGIQRGMNDLAKQKLNTDKLNVWFIRLERSIEKTIRQIIRQRIINPCDDPLKAKDYLHKQGEKRARDLDIERHLKKVRF